MQNNANQPDTKNFLAAIVISLLILFGYQTFWAGPQEKARQAELAKQKAQATQTQAAPTKDVPVQIKIQSREEALALSQRVKIDNALITGSLSLFGGRIDDVSLKSFKETVKKDSGFVKLLNPQGSKEGYFTFIGWASPDNAPNLPGPNTVWNKVSGDTLTPNTPVVLEFDNGAGLKFTRKISIDNEYLITYTDSVTNNSPTAINLQSYGAIRRFFKPTDVNMDGVNHHGPVGILNNELNRLKYREMEKGKSLTKSSKGGWFGIADSYWLVALLPDQSKNIDVYYGANATDSGFMYEASFKGPISSIAEGQTLNNSERVYAGSKKTTELNSYETRLGIPKFDNGIDWGVLWFISKPFYALLIFFFQKIGNIGLAILAVTVVVKIVTFPLVYQSYKSFAKMRELGPKMAEIKTKFPDDPARQQQETLKMYQTEKINPVAGCVPMFLTMPIFLALYKVLSITLELRHAPFYGWIPDLAAKDPTSFLNLFGLLPFDPTVIPIIGAMGIGIWPILYGASMWLMQKMQPTAPATDPVQQQVFALMPWFFAFIFGGFASGLVIYYTWSNLLTIVQQYIIAKRTGSPTVFDEWFAKKAAK